MNEIVKKLRVPLIIIQTLFLITGFVLILNGNNREAIDYVFFIPSYIIWLVVFLDILRNNPLNKTFWLFAMLVTPPVTPIFYLYSRERLLRLENSIFKKDR